VAVVAAASLMLTMPAVGGSTTVMMAFALTAAPLGSSRVQVIDAFVRSSGLPSRSSSVPAMRQSSPTTKLVLSGSVVGMSASRPRSPVAPTPESKNYLSLSYRRRRWSQEVSIEPVTSLFSSKNRLETENATLRQQLILLQRQIRGRVRFTITRPSWAKTPLAHSLLGRAVPCSRSRWQPLDPHVMPELRSV
jgi:hypothetical protein